MGQEVKEADRDLFVVCPADTESMGARRELPLPKGRGDLVSPAPDSVRYLYLCGDFGVSLSSQRSGSMMRNNDDAVSPVIGKFSDGADHILIDRTF